MSSVTLFTSMSSYFIHSFLIHVCDNQHLFFQRLTQCSCLLFTCCDRYSTLIENPVLWSIALLLTCTYSVRYLLPVLIPIYLSSWCYFLAIWPNNGMYHYCTNIFNLLFAGLSIHPVRPFLLASCSRDSTMRLWSLASFVAPLYLKVLAGKPDDEIIKLTGEWNFINKKDRIFMRKNSKGS